jgi:thymidylate synthase (FAD)
MKNKVELIGHYGSDLIVARAAWCSTGGETPEKLARVPILLKMLAENEHGTPFERSLLHFSVTCDTASHIQFLKHRMFSINGESARYKEYTENKYHLPEDWEDVTKDPTVPITYLEDHSRTSYRLYHEAVHRLEHDGYSRKRAKESARYFLPYAIQVNLDMSCNLRTFVHFQKLRNSEHAQLEIRDLAAEMLRLVKDETDGNFKYSLDAWGL